MIEWLLLGGLLVLYVLHTRTLSRRLGLLRRDGQDADEASMQAAFWRARAVGLGADPSEYRETTVKR